MKFMIYPNKPEKVIGKSYLSGLFASQNLWYLCMPSKWYVARVMPLEWSQSHTRRPQSPNGIVGTMVGFMECLNSSASARWVPLKSSIWYLEHRRINYSVLHGHNRYMPKKQLNQGASHPLHLPKSNMSLGHPCNSFWRNLQANYKLDFLQHSTHNPCSLLTLFLKLLLSVEASPFLSFLSFWSSLLKFCWRQRKKRPFFKWFINDLMIYQWSNDLPVI